ncbi:ATP-binding protein [Sorangium sp. So ce302]|uniref:AAA family ATPase n=1 Tax=Sorangium sp. So ce302 TaxID=3133297 RepID=UPI003F63BE67
MITRIEIDGFKSFQGFALDLEPLSVLIGPNGAGKSNLLDALSLLARLAGSPLAAAVGEGRGRIREQFRRRDEEPTTTVERGFGALASMALAIEVLLPRSAVRVGLRDVPLQATRLRYEVNIELQQLSSMRERLTVVREVLQSMTSDEDTWLRRHPAFASRLRHGDGGALVEYERALTVADPSASQFSMTATVQYVPEATFLSEPEMQARSPHLRAVAEELSGLRVLHLEAQRIREPSEPGAPARLSTDGANLAATLAAQSPGAIAEIRADVASLVPGVRTFEVVVEGDTLVVQMETSDGQRLPSRVLSDGTLRILALSTALRADASSALIAIEEPENGLHPARVRTLIERILEATQRPVASDTESAAAGTAQVLITSHSPVVLAALMDHPECIMALDLVRLGSGLRHTRVRRVAPVGVIDRERYISTAELRRILETASPAELAEA